MTADRSGLGPLGRRLLGAFLLVALSSVVVLTLAALIGTARGLAAGEDAQRQSTADAVADAVAVAYRSADGWVGADLSRALDLADSAGAGLAVRDSSGASQGPGDGMQGQGQGGGGRGVVVAPVVVDGVEVGSVRLGFGSPSTSTAQTVAWTWILAAAVVAILVAFVVAWFVSRRIAGPLVRLATVARSFAAGDRSVRADPADVAAPGELGELARSFDATADEVVRSESTRRRMAADIAHELRTPLAALQAGLEELRDGLVEPDAQRLSALHDQSLRLARVVGDLAELASAESAALSMRRDLVSLSGLIVDAVAVARPSLAAARIHVATSVEDDVTVLGDSDRLHQAVGNLLGNVSRHCQPEDQVSVTVRRDGDDAIVTVADTGPGIDPADLSKVFDRLWRGSADRDGPGSGIGLAVVRELVAAHGGVIQAQSDGRTGTAFTIRLPSALTTR